MKPLAISLVSGFVFGLGLSLSQMINPVKVTNFLDITGHWDPSLILVMGGALLITLISFRFILQYPTPLYAKQFNLPTRTIVDWKLVTGAALFGIGWGMTGYCPGPAVASLGLRLIDPFVMVVSIVAGFFLHRVIFERRPG